MTTAVWGAVWGYLDRGLRGLIPFVLTIELVLISVLPIPVPGTGPITPALTLMAVYYWSVYRPDLLPIAATFIIGVVQDTLSGAPLGMTSLVLLSVQGVVMAQYRFFSGKTFMVEWWGFLVIAPSAITATYLLATIYSGTLLSVRPFGFQLMLTVALYPCIAWLLARAQQFLLRPA